MAKASIEREREGVPWTTTKKKKKKKKYTE